MHSPDLRCIEFRPAWSSLQQGMCTDNYSQMNVGSFLLGGGTMAMQTEKMTRYFGVLLALLIGFMCQHVWAQANRATITGTVTDSTGAVVAGVEVTATNTGTIVPTKTVSNHDGIYVVHNLFPGPYSVQFVRTGFETVLRPSVNLNSTQVAEIRLEEH